MPGNVPAAGDILQIRVGCSTATQEGLNVLHYRVAATANGGLSLQNIADQLDANFAAVWKNWMPASAQYRGVGATNISGERTNEFIAITRAGPGIALGDLLPTQVTGLITFRTELAGRHFRGRMYPPFPSEGFTGPDATMNATGTAAIVAIGTVVGPSRTLTVGAVADTLALVVLHRPTPARPIPPASLTTDVTTITPILGFATQRRRGDFGRQNQPPF